MSKKKISYREFSKSNARGEAIRRMRLLAETEVPDLGKSSKSVVQELLEIIALLAEHIDRIEIGEESLVSEFAKALTQVHRL